jgi:regulator of cell morphogenesis and NO signaling
MSTITLTRTVGELVTEKPARARIFETFGIDFCCGGKKPLEQACREKNLDPTQIVGVLNVLDQQVVTQEPDWSKAPMSELADHIVKTHHDYLRRQLPWLDFVTDKVARRHGDHDPRLLQVREIFISFKVELESHMAKEEQVLFPIVRRLESSTAPVRSHCGSVQNPIRVMIAEHDDAGHAMSQFAALTDGYVPPDGACNTYRAMLDGLKELELDMHRHVHKENSILFPRAIEAEAKLLEGVV